MTGIDAFLTLAIGALLGFSVCFGAFFALAQIVTETGWLRRAYIALLGLLLTVMGALYGVFDKWEGAADLIDIAKGAGALMTVPALYATVFEQRFRRFWPLMLGVFGFVVASGAPFAGG
ncbi:MAG: hypothetical protein AAFV62_02810 [Pseudomonadota bacterium]